MLEIDHTLLSADALNNLIIDIITREATEYGEFEIELSHKIKQVVRKLEAGEAVIVYCSSEGFCEIFNSDAWKKMKIPSFDATNTT